MRPMFDYSKLLGKIKEKGYSQNSFAECLNINASTLSLKLSNKAFFTQKEMNQALNVLGVDSRCIGEYFFTQKV